MFRGLFISVAFISVFLNGKASGDTSVVSLKDTIFYHEAFEEIKNMLEERQPLSFKRAVFISENAYLGNKLDYKNFCDVINEMVGVCKMFKDAICDLIK